MLTGSLGRKYVTAWKETAAASGGAFDQAVGLVSHFHMGTCAKAPFAPPPPTGTAIEPGVTPLNAETTGAHWNDNLALDYGVQSNEMVSLFCCRRAGGPRTDLKTSVDQRR